MNTFNQRLPMLVLGAGFAAVLGGAFFFLFSGPQPAPAATPNATAVVKSTISHDFSSSSRSLPLGSQTVSAYPAAEAYNTETQPNSGTVTPQLPPQVQTIDSSQPGNQISFHGQTVSIAQSIPSSDGGGNELAVDIVPTASKPTLSNPAPAETKSGLSAEEELFRAKWGWAMTDAAKASAMAESDPASR